MDEPVVRQGRISNHQLLLEAWERAEDLVQHRLLVRGVVAVVGDLTRQLQIEGAHGTRLEGRRLVDPAALTQGVEEAKEVFGVGGILDVEVRASHLHIWAAQAAQRLGCHLLDLAQQATAEALRCAPQLGAHDDLAHVRRGSSK
jgi:hypothetical protein